MTRHWILQLVLGCVILLTHSKNEASPKVELSQLEKSANSLFNFDKDSVRCDLCLEIMKEISRFFLAPQTEQCLEALMYKICTALHIEDATVCRGDVMEYGLAWRTVAAAVCCLNISADIFIRVIDSLLFDPKRVCGTLVKGCGGQKPDMRPNGYWRVPMLNTTKPSREKPVLPGPDMPKLRVVHLTDLHLDKNYAIGSEADCKEPLCCRQTNATEVTQPAGKWGTVAPCDIPRRTLESMLQHLASRTDIDYFIWTGDAPPHNIWNQSKADQLEVLSTLNGLFTKYFPNRLLISSVGNHESAPAGSFAPDSADIPSEYSTSWLYNTLADQWTQFGIGQDNDTHQSIRDIASYVTNPFPGLRVISLNTMYGLEGNYWLYMSEYDPNNVLVWLIRQLQDAEDGGDKVHIISHVPPNKLLKEWSANFYDIVNRYENTITGMFFGHTHDDTFTVFYENGTLDDPIQVAYVAPSGTTYTNHWPSFRIYTIDGQYNGSSYRVLDHETYVLNLTDANVTDNPKWQLEYTAKEAYNMDSQLPDAWNNLIQKFIDDDDLFQKYYKHVIRAPTELCDQICKYSYLCNMRQGRSFDVSFCQDLPGFEEQHIRIKKSILPTGQVQNQIRRLLNASFWDLFGICHF